MYRWCYVLLSRRVWRLILSWRSESPSGARRWIPPLSQMRHRWLFSLHGKLVTGHISPFVFVYNMSVRSATCIFLPMSYHFAMSDGVMRYEVWLVPIEVDMFGWSVERLHSISAICGS